MKLLMIVGSGDSVFVYNITKWLKSQMNITIDIFELEPTNKQTFYNYQYYNSIHSTKKPTIKNKIVQKVFNLFSPYIKSFQLKKYLKDKQYDVIHAHWITNSLVISHFLKKHCSKLFITFWGGEISHQKIFNSNYIYRLYLNKFCNHIDTIVNSQQATLDITSNLRNYKGKYHYATLGSSTIEYIIELMNKESKATAKIKLGMPIDKIVVMIGYSGKTLHQHIPIIKELQKKSRLKNKIHLFAPMTRDCNPIYTQKVEHELIKSGFSYTILKNKYLTDEEVARIRLATDIIFQFSIFDGFSRSIIECICAKALLLYGDWLNYKKRLDEFGFEAISCSSIENGVTQLEEIAYQISSYNKTTEKNAKNGGKKLLWSECINDWVNLYQS